MPVEGRVGLLAANRRDSPPCAGCAGAGGMLAYPPTGLNRPSLFTPNCPHHSPLNFLYFVSIVNIILGVKEFIIHLKRKLGT